MMSSWQLLRHLFSFWDGSDNPLFLREQARKPMWRSLLDRLAKATGLVLMLGGLWCYVSTLLVFYANNLLAVLAPLTIFWTVLIGLTLAPLIVREREQRTWEVLRTTPLDVEMMLLGKAGGALWWISGLIRVMSGLLLLEAIGMGLFSLVLVPLFTNDVVGAGASGVMMCATAVLLPLTGAVVFILDRAQHFVLTGVAGLATSAASRTVRAALVAGTVATFSIWLFDMGIPIVVLALHPDNTGISLLTLATLGPMAGYLIALPARQGIWLLIGTLIGREIVVRLLWRWTVHTAHKLDV